MIRNSFAVTCLGLLILLAVPTARAQLVGFPDPHLLTLMPMGAQRGTSIEVKIGGANLEDVTQLIFSDPKITARPAVGEDGKPVENKFLVTVAADAPAGVHDARVMSRLGISSPRAFTVGALPEKTFTEPRDFLHKAAPLAVNSIGNAIMPQRAIDYYAFEAKQGQALRHRVRCRGNRFEIDAGGDRGRREGAGHSRESHGRSDRFHPRRRRNLHRQGERPHLQG